MNHFENQSTRLTRIHNCGFHHPMLYAAAPERHNNAWAQKKKKKPTRLWTNPNCSTDCNRLEFPSWKGTIFTGAYSCFQKGTQTPQSKGHQTKQRRREDYKMLPPELCFNFSFLSHYPEAHTEALYHWVVYVTVQSNPFPQGQLRAGPESFMFSCCHTCLNYDVPCTGDMTVIYYTAGDPTLFINT